jgi:Ca2+-binding EF-hand superfamily protein
MTEENIKLLIQEVDINHDDVVDYNEFLEMMKKDLIAYHTV